jgi:hypothetical protein
MQTVKRLNALHLLVLAFGVLLTLCAWQAGGPDEILGTLPAILLLACLAFNRYPGEELIERLARSIHGRRPRPASVAMPARHATPLSFRLLPSLATVRPLRGPPALSSLSI